jgi:hypothetical protein
MHHFSRQNKRIVRCLVLIITTGIAVAASIARTIPAAVRRKFVSLWDNNCPECGILINRKIRGQQL